MTVSNLTVAISGTVYPVLLGSWDIADQLDQITQCSFTIEDNSAAWHFDKGDQVIVSDSVAGTQFTGFVETIQEAKIAGQVAIQHTIVCNDNSDIPARRTTNKQYINQYSGVIMASMVNDVLAAEGITANYAVRFDASQSDFATGTLSGTVATTTNTGDGDLELALAGTATTYTINSSNYTSVTLSNGQIASDNSGITISSFNAIQLIADCTITGLSNAFLYVKIWSGSYTVIASDTFQYTIWINGNSPTIQAGIDFVCTDGTTFRDSGILDGQRLNGHPGDDLSGFANNQWYSRSFTLSPTLTGKTISYMSVSFEGQSVGHYVAYFHAISIINGASTKVAVFSDTSTSTQVMPQILGASGYTNMQTNVVTAYLSSGSFVTAAMDLSPASIYKSSILSWSAIIPNGCDIKVAAVTDRTISQSSTIYLPCSNGGIVPGLNPGMTLASLNALISVHLYNNNPDPLYSTKFQSSTMTINPSYAATKTDVRYKAKDATNYTAGTLTNLIAFDDTISNNDYITINGYQDPFAFIAPVGTVYGIGNPAFYINIKTLYVQADSNGGAAGDAKLKLTNAGTWQDFTMEVDLLPHVGTVIPGVVYRTTNWSSGLDTCAYQADVSLTQIKLGRGSNSGTGSYTQLGAATLSLQVDVWHRLKVVVSGSNHKMYLDDVLYVNVTDSTYAAAGNVGLKIYNNTGTNVQVTAFRNFGIVSALSGTWVSPAIDVSAAGTAILGSFLRTIAIADMSQTSLTTAISLNNGSTWTNCPLTSENTYTPDTDAIFAYLCESVPGLLAGTNVSALTQVKIRHTLTTSTATANIKARGTLLYVLSQYSASGTRIAPVSSLAPANRAGATLVAWNANMPTNTALTVATSLDNVTYTSVSNGGTIAGITSQAAQTLDTFDVNSSSSYTATARTGGTAGTWTWDTSNSRIVITTGETNAVLLRNSLTAKDLDMFIDLDQADQGGFVWRWQDASNFYELDIADSTAVSGANTIKLYKVVANTKTQIGSTATISFIAGTPHRLRTTMFASSVTIYFDGISVMTATDSSITASGSVGLFAGTGFNRVYNFRVSPQGDDLTGKSVYVKSTLTSTNPTATPQLLDITTAALSPDIGIGSLVTVDYRNTYVSANIADLVKQSNYYDKIRADKSLVFQARQLVPAPWLLTSSDPLLNGLTVDRSGELYRNRQVLTNVLDTGTFTEIKAGDGSATSWSLGYAIVAAPTILLNGQAQTVGIKGIDSGKAFYWEYGSTTITQDSSGTTLRLNIDVLTLTYTGQFPISVTRDNTSFAGTITQSVYQSRAGGSGIVENVEDVASLALSVSAAQSYGDTLLQRYGVIGRTVNFKTLRTGLASGQYLPVFLPEHGINDAAMLVTQANVTMKATVDSTTGQNTVQYWYECVATEGPNLGTWIKLFES